MDPSVEIVKPLKCLSIPIQNTKSGFTHYEIDIPIIEIPSPLQLICFTSVEPPIHYELSQILIRFKEAPSSHTYSLIGSNSDGVILMVL